MNMIQKMVQIFNNGIAPGTGLKHRYYRSYHYDYFRKRDYYNRNSMFIENIYDKIATDIGLIDFKHIKVTKRENGPDIKEFLEHGPLQNVLAISPNNHETPIVFWTNVVRKMLKDKYAVVIPTYKNGEIDSIQLVDGIVEIDKNFVTILINEKEVKLNKLNLWIFENPKTSLSVQLDGILRLIDSNLRSLSERIDEKPRLKGLLKIPTKVEDTILKNKAQQRVKNIMDVAANGEIGYLQQGEEFQELKRDYGTATNEELEFLKTQLYNTTGLNEDLFTCNYNETQYRAYLSSILKIYISVIKQEITRKYFTKTARTQGHKLMMTYDLFELAPLKDLTDFAFRMKYSAIYNANEIRGSVFGDEGYIGGDVYETNANAIRVDNTGGD